MKKISILGSTGSIGVNTLDLIGRFPDRFQVVGLVAGSNHRLLDQQIKKFRPRVVSLSCDGKEAALVQKKWKRAGVEVLIGMEGASSVASLPETDLVVSAIVGSAGLVPTLTAIQHHKNVALANKETMVIAGEIVCQEVKDRKVSLIPIDSEHSAIFQLLAEEPHGVVRRVILTGSGGPLYGYSKKRKESVTPDEALNHPTWKMGRKISIDSATLMNKGFEAMEARWLFNLPPEKIEVLIHRQSIVHSMVEFVDRSMVAQMGLPDMRVPISYALHYPERATLPFPSLALEEIGALTFERPDLKAYPLLLYAYELMKAGGTYPAVLNAANEIAVSAFLSEKISFPKIEKVIRKTVSAHTASPIKTVEEVLEADRWGREMAEKHVKSIS